MNLPPKQLLKYASMLIANKQLVSKRLDQFNEFLKDKPCWECLPYVLQFKFTNPYASYFLNNNTYGDKNLWHYSYEDKINVKYLMTKKHMQISYMQISHILSIIPHHLI